MGKKSLTLIEVTIGCALLAVLLSILFATFGEVKKVERIVLTERRDLNQERRRWVRLDQIFSSLKTLSKGKVVFFLEEGKLVFYFDRGADLDPKFSGQQLGALFVDEKKRFVLLTWPNDGRNLARQEVLADQVEKIDWEFFVPPDFKPSTNSPSERREGWAKIPKGGWVFAWDREYQAIPPLIRLTLTLSDETSSIYETYLPATTFPLEIID